MHDRGSTGESHVARLFKFAPPMCSVHSRTGHEHAVRLVRLAARQLTAVAQPLQDLLASARSCVPLRMRSITTGVSHLYRADPSSGHQAPMLLRHAGGCDDGSAARRTCSRALSSLADSDPKARSALHTQKGSNRPSSHQWQASAESATLRSLSERLTPGHGCKADRARTCYSSHLGCTTAIGVR